MVTIILIVLSTVLCACAGPSAEHDTRYRIDVTESEYGTVIPSALSAYAGEKITLDVRPDENCCLQELRCNGVLLESTEFEMPASDVKIEAVFGKILFAVEIGKMTGGTLTADKQVAAAGETVTVTAIANEGFALVKGSIAVNGEVITDDHFVMPANDVTLTAEFIEAEDFPESACAVRVTAANSTAEARWYARYDTAGIHITVRVKDETLTTGNGDFGYDDNAEFIIGLKSDAAGLDKEYSYKFLVTAGGKYYLQKAINDTQFGTPSDLSLNIAPGSNFYYNVTEVRYADGVGGYRADIYFGYDLLNTDAASAYGNLTIMPALRNTNGMHSQWGTSNSLGAQWSKAYTFAVIREDGSIEPRDYA